MESSVNLQKSWSCYSAPCSSPSRPWRPGVWTLSIAQWASHQKSRARRRMVNFAEITYWLLYQNEIFFCNFMILCGTSSSNLDILKGQKGQSEIKEGTSFGTASRFDALGLLPFPSFPWHPDSRLKVKEIGNQGCGWSPPPPHRQTSSGRFGAGLLVLVPLLVFHRDLHLHQQRSILGRSQKSTSFPRSRDTIEHGDHLN